MGLNSSSDAFNVRTDDAVWDLFEWLLKIVDDMLVQGASIEQVFRRLQMVLLRCRAAGIKLSLDKLEVGTSVKFAGYIVSSEGDPTGSFETGLDPILPNTDHYHGASIFSGIGQSADIILAGLAASDSDATTIVKEECGLPLA
jgi:hypothetical protein